MPREKRRKSETGIYHIMLRGIDKRKIFINDRDKEKFIECINKAKEKGKFLLLAYCLMDNHVHLLIKENEEIGNSIKRIAVSYVQYHNTKYDRTGHLFQNRFKSEVVENETYLLVVTRYIHQNPIRAKIIKNMSDYKWSSYNEYLDKYNGKTTSIDTQSIEDYFVDKKSFIEFMTQSNEDVCLEYKTIIKYSDEQLGEILQRRYNIEQLKVLSGTERDKLISEIKEQTGASIRQLSRVLNIGRKIIEKAGKER